MKVTKQEQAIIIGIVISALGEQIVNACTNTDKLEKVSVIHNEMHDNTTPRERREAMINLLDKTMDELLED
ncbi:hypothetical protein [Bacillus toyonensis]|uniref:Phage protein n=1 Tax=Bacillus toyonensis TaxID=155322 RepID=A0A2B5X3S9_9BACI|nr:hypothetical protein [Bacillus toyonensis]PGA91033.1 hypothetical protein COL93_27630 [Bacillus toyonensis]PHD67096.1 hypothetical protein COF40_20150 [Bacillus toyonensis]